ncbi:MAG TPA: AEC family transporter [Steroidobacteraceae bacterium]
MTQIILSALLPVVFVVALGVLAAHFGIVQKSAAPLFAAFVVGFALPLALFEGVLNVSASAIKSVPFLIAIAAGLMAIYVVALIISQAIFHHSLSESAIQAITCAFPSMAYSGPPVLEAVVGPEGVPVVVVGNLVTSLIMIPVTLMLVEVGQGDANAKGNTTSLAARSLANAIKQPVVWLPIAGAALALGGVHLPRVLYLSFDLIGKSAAGVALFALGLILYGQPLRLNREVAFNALVKNVGQPAAFLGLALLLGIHGTSAKELFLTGAIPTATAASALALRYHIYSDEAAASTLLSTAGSVVTISLAIFMAEHFA